MYKKYIVRLSDEERGICQEVIKKLKGSSQNVSPQSDLEERSVRVSITCTEVPP
jgi:hypothetical protein